MHYKVVVECALEYQGRFLIVERPVGAQGAGLLVLPGGKVDNTDGTPHADILRTALIREVAEELGITWCDPLTYVTSSFFIDHRGVPIIDVIFYGAFDKTPVQIIPFIPCQQEVPAYYWLSPEEIYPAPNGAPWLAGYIKLALHARNK